MLASLARPRGLALRSSNLTGRTGGNRTPNPRFWRPVLCQLSYCPSLTEGLRPSDSPTRHSLALPARSVPWVASLRSLAISRSRCARSQLSFELLRFAMRDVLAAEAAVLAQLQPLAGLLLVLGRAVIAPLTLGARQGMMSLMACPLTYSMISLIVPAPTVRPPSRIAKRAPFSSATGTCSSAVIEVLSPGITISTPSGSLSEPVTSVVRM